MTVSDAQYVRRGDPARLPPNPDPTGAYFEAGETDRCGRSETKLPFNRSYLPPVSDADEESREESEDGQESVPPDLWHRYIFPAPAHRIAWVRTETGTRGRCCFCIGKSTAE